MKKMNGIRRSLVTAGATLALVACAAALGSAASEEANVYFNAGMEKYLQGSFIESVENLEKAQKLDPANPKIKELMVKILLEAATQNHLNRNYRQAFVFMKKAHDIAPDNAKVQEMYQLTQEMMTPTQEKVVPREKSMRIKKAEPAPVDEVKPATAERKDADVQKRDEPRKAVRPVVVAPRSGDAASDHGPLQFFTRMKERQLLMLLIWLIASPLIILSMAMFVVMKGRELGSAKSEIMHLNEETKRLNDERSAFMVELEKARESVKYEHRIAESSQKELKETSKREEDRIRMELDMRTRQMEEKIRSEMAQKYRSVSVPREGFLQREEENFMRYADDASAGAGPGEETSPALESTRERIALMAQNLYEYAPGAAIEFLEKMARNDNALVRSNVVQALTIIAKPDTLEILFRLYQDNDPRVKREALKRMKQLMQKISSGSVELSESLRQQLAALIAEEKSKGEWIF